MCTKMKLHVTLMSYPTALIASISKCSKTVRHKPSHDVEVPVNFGQESHYSFIHNSITALPIVSKPGISCDALRPGSYLNNSKV